MKRRYPQPGPLALNACRFEVMAPKAGNVNLRAGFDGLTWGDFFASADACLPHWARAGRVGVGPTVLRCVEATREKVGSNTNLGIILLLTPLCAVRRDESLRQGVRRVLAGLTDKDSRAVYEAIRLARPGGLGSVSTGDVHDQPTLPIRRAMRLAAGRDAVARQWANGYREVLGSVLRYLRDAAGRFPTDQAIVLAQLRLLADEPDSLIHRKCGAKIARESQARARAMLKAGWPETKAGQRKFTQFDRWLRADGHRRNPGTTADLITAGIFAWLRELKDAMKVFVFEHLCSGGAAGNDLPAELAELGGAMLRATAGDLARVGASVATSLDRRVTLPLPGVAVTFVDSQPATLAAFDGLSAEADHTLVIAPESDGLLVGWLRRLEERECGTLNCDWRAAELCGDKLAMAAHLARHGVPTPATRSFKRGESLSLPAVVKPRRGAGCERTYLIRTAGQAAGLADRDDWITQDWVPGAAASCAVMAKDGRARPLLPGLQRIAGDSELSYRGGRMPLDGRLGQRAAALAKRAVETVAGARGYVGVDLVLGQAESDDRVIEVNPRVSMSYIGLAALCRSNLAAALLDPEAPLAWSGRRLSFDVRGGITWEDRP